MLKILPTRGGGDAIPGALTTLSVSWIGNRFKAVAVHRGAADSTFERTTDKDGLGDFQSLLREAAQKTGYRGQTVSLVLRHPQLVQQLVDVPSIKGAELHKLVERQAQQQKVFPGEAVWTVQPAFLSKGNQRLILHLFPKALLEQLISAAQNAGFDLVSVIPVSAVLHRQLTQLPLGKDDIAMLAAETGGVTTVVVGRQDGQLLLVRTLPGGWGESGERLAVDLNRTNAFISQQYGLTVNRGLWLFGEGADEQAVALQKIVELPVAASPLAADSFCWATDALKLRASFSPNFVTPELQTAPQRRVFARVVAAATMCVVILCLIAAAIFAVMAKQELKNIAVLNRRTDQLLGERQSLQKRNGELDAKRAAVHLIMDDRLPPVPTFMLGYLGDSLPAGLTVTDLHVKRGGEQWKFEIAGTVQSGAPAGSVAALADRLANGPFHAAITSNTKNAPGHFAIEGVMR